MIVGDHAAPWVLEMSLTAFYKIDNKINGAVLKYLRYTVYLVAVGLLISGCGKTEQKLPVALLAPVAPIAPSGQNLTANGGATAAAVRTSILSPDDQICENGGVLVEAGIDVNGNGLLDQDEVDSVDPICQLETQAAGTAGDATLNSLVALSQEPIGTNCLTGGVKIDTGIDWNQNRVLDSAEITVTEFVCNEEDGLLVNTGTITGDVIDYDSGVPLSGAEIAAGGISTVSGPDGRYTLRDVPMGSRIPIALKLPGYAAQAKIISLGSGETASVTLKMIPISYSAIIVPEDPLPIIDVSSGAGITFVSSELVTDSGVAPVGDITANITVIDPTQNSDVMPGDYIALENAVSFSSLESFGAISVEMLDGEGNTVNLKGGSTSTIQIPLADKSGSPPATTPLFYFDPSYGTWVEEGVATLGDRETSPVVYTGTVSRFQTWTAGKIIEQQVAINGCVETKDNVRIANAHIHSDGDSYIGSAYTSTDSNGEFSVLVKSGSTGFISAQIDGRKSNTIKLTTTSDPVFEPECLVIGAEAITIRLTWGAKPRDLDAYLYGPDYLVSWKNKGALDRPPFAQLDIDAQNRNGPEIITINKFDDPGTYIYSVYNFLGEFDVGMTGSPARVELTYNGAVTLLTPPEGEGNNRYWHAIEFVVSADGEITVNILNEWSDVEP